MTKEKYETEVAKLHEFFHLYCCNKHTKTAKSDYCDECQKLLDYAVGRLKECKQDPKPRCRNCNKICYTKVEWKQIAKVMIYSSVRLGLSKIFGKKSS